MEFYEIWINKKLKQRVVISYLPRQNDKLRISIFHSNKKRYERF